MSDVSHDQALQLMAVLKLCSTSLVWSHRDNHVGLLLALTQPEDESRAILPGLTLQLEIKRPIVVDRCLYEFGLFLLERRRAPSCLPIECLAGRQALAQRPAGRVVWPS